MFNIFSCSRAINSINSARKTSSGGASFYDKYTYQKSALRQKRFFPNVSFNSFLLSNTRRRKNFGLVFAFSEAEDGTETKNENQLNQTIRPLVDDFSASRFDRWFFASQKTKERSEKTIYKYFSESFSTSTKIKVFEDFHSTNWKTEENQGLLKQQVSLSFFHEAEKRNQSRPAAENLSIFAGGNEPFHFSHEREKIKLSDLFPILLARSNFSFTEIRTRKLKLEGEAEIGTRNEKTKPQENLEMDNRSIPSHRQKTSSTQKGIYTPSNPYSSRNIFRILFLLQFESSSDFSKAEIGKEMKNESASLIRFARQSGISFFGKQKMRETNKNKQKGRLPRRKVTLFTKKLSSFLSSSFNTLNESFPTIRINQRKIPVIPIFLSVIPYVLFLGIRQTFVFLYPETANLGLGRFSAILSHFQPIGYALHQKPLISNLNSEIPYLNLAAKRRNLNMINKINDINISGIENLWVLGLPSILSKFFVLWAIQSIASIRPQRKISQKAEESHQARILFPNEIKVKFENLQGLTAVLPLLSILIESLNAPYVFPFGTQNPFSWLSGRSDLWFSWFFRFAEFGFFAKKPATNSFATHKYPKGYLFVGPPGTGKTRLAQALAKEAKVALLCVSASEIQKQIEIGTRIGALRLRKVFESARCYAPCILFFDEIDAIGKTRGYETNYSVRAESSNEENQFSSSIQEGPERTGGDNQLLTEFLIQMDSFSVDDGFVVVGTTNFLHRLDSAFIRSGRFDRIISLNSPSKKIRLDILQAQAFFSEEQLIKNAKAASPFNKLNGTKIHSSQKTFPWNYFGHYTNGFSPAHLALLINESLLYSCSHFQDKKQSLPARARKLFNIFESSKRKQEIGRPKHSFESLQHGLNRIQTHRKNFPPPVL